MSSRKIFLPSLHISGHQTGESLLQVIRDIFAVRKNHKTGGNLGILHEKMIWTLFRIINLHPMQISITSQAIRKSLKRASTRSESHRAIVHFYYVFHSAYSYLSFFLADRVSIVPPYIFRNFKNFRSNGRRFVDRREKMGRRKGRRRPSRKTRKPLRPRRFGG